MILPLEKQVVSKELAQQLKEAGFPQETLFYYYEESEEPKKVFVNYKAYQHHCKWAKVIYAAPTGSELSAILPKSLYVGGKIGRLVCDWANDCLCSYQECEAVEGRVLHWEKGATEADARALMWLWLKKEGQVA